MSEMSKTVVKFVRSLGYKEGFSFKNHSSIIIIDFFFGLQTLHIIFSFLAPSSLVFTMLSNRLRLLAVRLNELETSLIYNS